MNRHNNNNNQKVDLIKIDDIYEHVTNNKIFVDLPVSDFDQDNIIRVPDKVREENNYVIDLINSFKSNNINTNNNKKNNPKNNNKVVTNINPVAKIKNSFLYFIGTHINDEISNIKLNIKKHIDDEDYEPIKNISSSYKKGIQAIKVFLIEENSDLQLNDFVLYYISYLYKISIIIKKNKIFREFNYFNKKTDKLEIETYSVLVFEKVNKDSFELIETISNELSENYINSNKLLKYYSSVELNKLKIQEIRTLCQQVSINTDDESNIISQNKMNIIIYLNTYFSKFEDFKI